MNVLKITNIVIIFLQLVAVFAFGVFIISNWSYISNPYQIPTYHGTNSIFEYQHFLAKYKDWGFFYPWIIIIYLTFFQTILLGFLVFKKGRKLKWIEIIFVSVFLLLIFLIKDLVSVSFYFVAILILGTIFLFFRKTMKAYRFFLFINVTTIILWNIFLFGYIELFFD